MYADCTNNAEFSLCMGETPFIKYCLNCILEHVIWHINSFALEEIINRIGDKTDPELKPHIRQVVYKEFKIEMARFFAELKKNNRTDIVINEKVICCEVRR